MAVLITGARGFVGSRLAFLLRKRGLNFINFDGDITDRPAVLSWSSDKKIETVIHLAAVISSRDKGAFKNVNVFGTANIIGLCQKINAERIVFMSSMRVNSAQANDPYINSKKEAENLIIGSGLPYVILRPSLIYGPGDKKNIGLFLKMAKILPLVPVFDFKMQPIYIDDLVKIIIASIKIAPNQVFNLAGREPVSYAELLELLKTKGLKIRYLNAPRLFNFLLRIFSFLPFSPLSHRQVKTLLADEIFETSPWPELFKLKYTSLDEGLAKII